MKKAAIIGCSLASGWKMKNDDLVDHEDPGHPQLWANRLLQDWGYDKISNFASTGADNDSIFQLAVENILPTRYDLVLVQWTYLDRLNLNVGLELYPTRSMLKTNRDIDLVNNLTISGYWLDDLGNRIKSVTNLHWKILKLIQYVNLLTFIQTNKNAKILFVNGACFWPDDYFRKIDYRVPSELPKFTQNLLQSDHRDDSETRQLYDLIHQHYEKNQGIQNNLWLNLYNPLIRMRIDTMGEDDFHPGWMSQDVFFQNLKSQGHIL